MTINSLVGTECPTEILKIINQIIAQKSTISLDNLDATGEQKFTDLQDGIDAVNALVTALTAVVNTKISADCLLQQNGYIKFSNGLLIQWGYVPFTSASGQTTYNVLFPISATTTMKCFTEQVMTKNSSFYDTGYVKNVTTSSFDLWSYYGTTYFSGAYWFAIGY